MTDETQALGWPILDRPVESERLLVRQTVHEDLDAFVDGMMEPRVRSRIITMPRFLFETNPATGRPHMQVLFEREIERACRHLTIVDQETGDFAGALSVSPFQDGEAEVGVWIVERFAGRGYGAEAVRAVVDRLFEETGLSRAVMRMAADNDLAASLGTNAAFEPARTRSRLCQAGGKPVRTATFHLTRETWETRQAAPAP